MADVEPILIGMVDDISAPGTRTYERCLRVGLDQAIASGRLDRPVELIYEEARGLPSGTTHDVVRTFGGLLERGVVVILGPTVTDNVLAIVDVADRAKVPCLQWAGSEETRSEWVFNYQAGSLEDEPALLAEYAASQGLRRVAVVHDTAATGLRMMSFFDRATARFGLQVVFRRGASALGSLPPSTVPDLLATRPDVVVHLGMWSLVPLAARLQQAAPALPKLSNIAASVAQVRTEWLPPLEGWIFTGMSSESNPTGANLAAHIGRKPPLGTRELVGLDVGRLLAEALVNAPLLAPSGVRAGLELIKVMPAAAGHNGTVLGFGHWDRAALKGRYLVLQRYRGGRAEQL